MVILVLLLLAELIYFRIADRFNIIDKPNARSSHSSIVLRGGGIIFLIGVWVWSAFFGFQYPWMLAAVTLAAGISFVDDVRSLPDSVRLVAQFLAMGLLILQLFLCGRQQGFLTDSNLLMTIVFIVYLSPVFFFILSHFGRLRNGRAGLFVQDGKKLSTYGRGIWYNSGSDQNKNRKGECLCLPPIMLPKRAILPPMY